METLTHKKIRVKFSSQYPDIPYLRQTPGSKGVWGNCEFITDESETAFDWWFVWNNLEKPTRAYGPKNRTVLMTGEGNPDIKKYARKFIEQFGYIISAHPEIHHPHLIRRQVAPWMVGHFGTGSGVDPKDFKRYFTTYNTYKTMRVPEKTKLLAVVNASKNRAPGQRKRHAFISALKEHFKDTMDVFGNGINRISDKMDGIAPYQYYVMIENAYVPGYVTGIGDVYLGHTFPFYYGCPDLETYYSPEAFIRVDVDDPHKSIEIIEQAIIEHVYEKRTKAIKIARELTLNTYNIFAVMADFCNANADTPCVAERVMLKPEMKRRAVPQIVAETLRSLPGIYHVARWMYRKQIKKHHD
ncbi:MAG: hypothetical protein A3C06_02940 [Candidatus Taylorbacteria bacterium RIFCSPHIGHO2_02_FULL_46_13]|uniref:Fucosyltransferase C-terminal domain-containing protein n=1 Tax=Candidatus Taylorbacteria bacterium RIFCSPHIGHO2_02_FULL_46_13 TaxID=1802312 RepID=A0A1G2MRM2_9BACT|nr:MAG: hypothetical protein A3C06_02940 [Candidatus Taylorbacteria bacterium RIFCSPHIGHO2_02_FULL_46_13]